VPACKKFADQNPLSRKFAGKNPKLKTFSKQRNNPRISRSPNGVTIDHIKLYPIYICLQFDKTALYSELKMVFQIFVYGLEGRTTTYNDITPETK